MAKPPAPTSQPHACSQKPRQHPERGASKTGTLERPGDIRRRIEEAARFAPLDQLCLSPQCGFASTQEGNTLAEDEQWAKLRMITETARDVWG